MMSCTEDQGQNSTNDLDVKDDTTTRKPRKNGKELSSDNAIAKSDEDYRQSKNPVADITTRKKGRDRDSERISKSPERKSRRDYSSSPDSRDLSSRRHRRDRDSPSSRRRRHHSRSRDRHRRRSSPTPPRRRRRHSSRSPDRRRSRTPERRRGLSRSASRRRRHRRSSSGERKRSHRHSSSSEQDSVKLDQQDKGDEKIHNAAGSVHAPPPPAATTAAIPIPYTSAMTVQPSAMTVQQQQQLALSLVLGGNAAAVATNPALAALLGVNAIGLGSLGLGSFGVGGLGSLGFVEPKEMRELFVGNTPPGTNEMVLLEFLNLAMRHVKLATGPEGQDPVLTCRMNNKFAFAECRTAEDANRMLSLTNIPFMGALLKIGRPSKYVGPHTPAKTWQQLIAEMNAGGGIAPLASPTTAFSAFSTAPSIMGPVVDPNTKIYRELFVGNTSPEMSEQAILEFIGGAMEKMGLSSAPGNPVIHCRVSPRFAFIELRTIEETANCINISGIPFMGQSLKLSRPTKYAGPSLPYYEWDDLLARWMTGELKLQTAGHPSPVIRLTNMVVSSDLDSAESHADVVQDTTDECSQYGSVVRVIIPRPGDLASHVAVGKVFVEMESIEQAKAVLVALKGRTFDGRIVDAKFFPLDKLLRGDFSDPPPIVITSKGVTTVEAVIGNAMSLTAAQMSVGGALHAAIPSTSELSGSGILHAGNFCMCSHICVSRNP